jgi:hypothetical protein
LTKRGKHDIFAASEDQLDNKLKRLYTRYFKNRRHIVAMCSLPTDLQLFPEFMARGPQDEIVGLPDSLQDGITAGLYPLTTVVYDAIFELDVPGDVSLEYMERREGMGEAMTYSFQTTYLEAAVFKEISNRLRDELHQQGRRSIRSSIDESLWRFDCRSGERYVNVFLALEPIAGQRLSA